jgi:hypothetical protein
VRPFLTNTAPTAGFGLVLPNPRRANASARRMYRSSCLLKDMYRLYHFAILNAPKNPAQPPL